MQRADDLIGIRVEGLDEVVAAFSGVPKRLDPVAILTRVATQFENRLRAVTPLGWSGKLPASVISEVAGDTVRTGYEAGVETAGTKPRPRRAKGQHHQSVLHRTKWVRPAKLIGIFAEAFDAFSAEASSTIETELAAEVERVIS